MKEISLLLVLSFVYSFSIGQTVRYEGAFPNAQKEKGIAKYSYLKGAKTGRQIKQGAFRYQVKIKNGQSRLYRNITGDYKYGWKNGPWDYSYSTKDYNTNNDGFFYSYNVTLKANYDHGWPNGEWVYSSLIKRRKKTNEGAQSKWLPYEIVANTSMKLNYNMGLLVDSLEVRRLDRNVSAFMDKKGFMKGQFHVWSDTSDLTLIYKEGFVISTNNPSNDVNIQSKEYKFYQKHKDNLTDAGAQLDTSEVTFYSKNFYDNVFNDKYFNYLYIDGDRILNFVGKRKKLVIQFRGMYKRRLSVFITKPEEELIRGIYSFSIDAGRKKNLCTQNYKNSNKDIQARKKMDVANGIDKKLQAYTCLVKTYKSTLLLDEIAKKQKVCGTNITINSEKARIELLKSIYNSAKELSVKSKAIKCE